MSSRGTRCSTWIAAIQTLFTSQLAKGDWQTRDTVLACLTGYLVMKHYSTREAPLDRDVDMLSDDLTSVKGKLQDVSRMAEKQKRDLLVLKADNDEKLFALELKLRAVEFQVKSASGRRDDANSDCNELTREADLCYA